MNKYMLLLHDSTEGFEDISAEQIQAIIGEYVDWQKKIEAEGIFVGGEKLADEGGKHIQMSEGEIRVTDGPFAEVKEVLGGYFTISAENYDAAIEVSKGCPHLKYGGRIELREVDQMH